MSLTLARIREDVQAVKDRDPAARSTAEVVLAYPGLHALWAHHLAHSLHPTHPLLARLVSHASRAATGVEIHPGAVIGRRVVIDHGAGVVIGATAKVGDDVLIYHGVTLGGRTLLPGKRHPTIQDDVVLGAGATVLGPVTIGRGARIGADAVVVSDVPPHAVALPAPATIRTVSGPDVLPEEDPTLWI